MSIENISPDNTPENIKPSTDTKENFSRDEQKIIDDYSKEIHLIKNEIIDPSNMEAETKKVGGEAGWSRFFEQNYKTISKNPDKYPKLYPLSQTRLQNNKIAVDNMFEENMKEMKKTFTREEFDFCDITYRSYEMQSRLQQNPEKHQKIAWDKYNELLRNEILERIDHKERGKFTKSTNIVNRVVTALFYTAKQDIEKNTITDETKKQLISINSLFTNLSENSPALYENYSTIHQQTKEYMQTLATIQGDEMVNQMSFNMIQNKENEKSLNDFVKIANNKYQDPSVLKDAIIAIKPVLTSIYKNGLDTYTKAKEEQDPMKQIVLYNEAKEQFNQITAMKETSGADFSPFDEELELFCSLSKEMESEIKNIFSSNEMLPLLYDAGYKVYQEALITTDEDTKKEKYETAKTYFEAIIEQKTGKASKNMSDFIQDVEIKLKKIEAYLTPAEGSKLTVENINIADLPIEWGPSPFPKNSLEPFHLYVGEDKQQFDTIEIFNVTGQLVATYEINKDIFPITDNQSNLSQSYENPIQFELPLGEKDLEAGAYIFRISSKATKINKSEKFIVI